MHITIESLWKLGHNKTEISKMTNHDWKTVARVIKSLDGGSYPIKKPHPSQLDQYKAKIIELIEQDLTGVRIHEELALLGCGASYSLVKKYVANIKKHEDVCIRFNTSPGSESQVDFGYVGLTPDINEKRRKTWVFNMRLSYSRLDYYECVYDQKVETFIQCHMNAFNFFGGLPKRIKIDNLKAAILEAHFYEPVYQTLYKQFADYYGFQPLPCRVRKPQEKGKVESGIKYVKTNFFLGRKFNTYTEFKEKFDNWRLNKCNFRIHGTTRRIPQELFNLEEKHHLTKLPTEEFRIWQIGQRTVYHDCHVYINYNYYSVPFAYVGKVVDIEMTDKLVKIHHNGSQIAVHESNSGKGQFITIESHYPKYKTYLSTQYQESYQVKMNQIGNSASQLFLLLVDKNPHDWSRTVQGIISLTRDYSPEVVNMACKRAMAFNTLGYKVIKSICHNKTYTLPLEGDYIGAAQ